MDYRSVYIKIISNAQKQNRIKLRSKWADKEKTVLKKDWVYYEKHHILPKSLFPLWAKRKSNLVLLTAREHFFCHQLLRKIYPGKRMFLAVWYLANSKQNGYYVKGTREYARLRQIFIEQSSTPERRSQISQTVKKHNAKIGKDGRKKYGRDTSYENNPLAKPVICLNDFKVFTCIRRAKDYYNVSGIDRCCRNEVTQAKGYMFAYYNKLQNREYYVNLKQEKEEAVKKAWKIRREGSARIKYTQILASTGELFETITEASKWLGKRDLRKGIIKSHFNKKFTCGKHPITNEKIRWSILHMK